MKISFLGAARTVTGSNFLVETKNKKFIVDCGLFQGQSKETMLNTDEFQFDPTSIDFVLLTHAHIDHSGRIPKLFKEGYTNPIIATDATCDLCTIMLPDSGHIQEVEVEWINRKRRREGKHMVEPIYTAQDAIDCLKLFNPVKYNEIIEIDENIKVRFNEAGHMLGSSMIEVWVYEDGKEEKVVFTGDIGKEDNPLIRNRDKIREADYVVMESTYGGRLHKDVKNKGQRFLDIVTETLDKGGNVIIPSFAVGRTQEILYEIFKNRQTTTDEKYNEKIERLLKTPVYVDSPLAISATEIFKQNIDIFDEEAQEFISQGKIPIEFPGLKFTKTAEESRELNESATQSIIISASGMCEVGRIKHHLKHNLWKENSTVLFVGYQAEGTLGRKIIDGAKRVKIFGEEITVNARIEYIEGFSCHADQEDLLEFVSEFNNLKQIFIVHGEYEGQKVLSNLIREKYAINTVIPDFGDMYELNADSANKVGEIKPRDIYKYERLELLDRLETLREELDEMTIYIKQDLNEEDNDNKIKLLNEKILELEGKIFDIIKL